MLLPSHLASQLLQGTQLATTADENGSRKQALTKSFGVGSLPTLAAQLADNPITDGKYNREPLAQSGSATVKTITVGKLGNFAVEGNTQVCKLF